MGPGQQQEVVEKHYMSRVKEGVYHGGVREGDQGTNVQSFSKCRTAKRTGTETKFAPQENVRGHRLVRRTHGGADKAIHWAEANECVRGSSR